MLLSLFIKLSQGIANTGYHAIGSVIQRFCSVTDRKKHLLTPFPTETVSVSFIISVILTNGDQNNCSDIHKETYQILYNILMCQQFE